MQTRSRTKSLSPHFSLYGVVHINIYYGSLPFVFLTVLQNVCVGVCGAEWKLSKACAHVNFVLVRRNDRAGEENAEQILTSSDPGFPSLCNPLTPSSTEHKYPFTSVPLSCCCVRASLQGRTIRSAFCQLIKLEFCLRASLCSHRQRVSEVM